MSIVAKVYQGSSPSTLIATLSESKGRNWLHQLNDTGSGSVFIHAQDDDLAAHPTIINYDNIVRLNIDGTDRFAFIIESRSLDIAPSAELSGKWWELSGRGVLALLEDAIVYPNTGLVGTTSRDRTLGWMSVAYDDSAWTNAVQIQRQDATYGVTSTAWPHYPEHWPDANAYWIWSRAMTGSSPPAPVGTSYFRKDFTLSVDGLFGFFATADDGLRVWIDEELIIDQLPGDSLNTWRSTYRADRELGPGDHTLAIEGVNATFTHPTSKNWAGVLYTVAELDEDHHLTGSYLTKSTNTTKCLDYPASVPGMTVGQMIWTLILEAQARGALTGITRDFSDAVDSNSVSWATKMVLSLPIGTSLLDVARTLIEQSIDIEMGPTLVLSTYAKGTLGSNLTATVSLDVGSDLESLGASEELDGGQAQVANALVLRDASGDLTTREDATSLASHKRKELYIELGTAPSIAAAQTAGDAILAENAYPTTQLTGGAAASSGPYSSFGVGDLVTVPSMKGVNTDTQIVSIAVSEDNAGNPIYNFTASQLDT